MQTNKVCFLAQYASTPSHQHPQDRASFMHIAYSFSAAAMSFLCCSGAGQRGQGKDHAQQEQPPEPLLTPIAASHCIQLATSLENQISSGPSRRKP